MHHLPQKYGDSLYLKNCKELSGYPFPQNNWSGATLLVTCDDGVLLIKRASTMPTHANQWGCFGGKKQESERDPRDTAMREFVEESHLCLKDMSFEGYLPPVYTGSKTIVIPCVAKFSAGFSKFQTEVISNGEWDYGIFLPLSELFQTSLWSYGNRYGIETASQILFFHLNPDKIQYFTGSKNEHSAQSFVPKTELPLFWGATARMVWNFLSLCYTNEIKNNN